MLQCDAQNICITIFCLIFGHHRSLNALLLEVVEDATLRLVIVAMDEADSGVTVFGQGSVDVRAAVQN